MSSARKIMRHLHIEAMEDNKQKAVCDPVQIIHDLDYKTGGTLPGLVTGAAVSSALWLHWALGYNKDPLLAMLVCVPIIFVAVTQEVTLIRDYLCPLRKQKAEQEEPEVQEEKASFRP